MDIEFDPAKDTLNVRNHGMSLALATELDWSHAVILPDDRFFYDEARLVALAPLKDRIYHVAFTERGAVTRIISMRCAEKKEVAYYVRNYR